MAKQTFTAGQVLTATQVNGLQTNDFNQTVSTKTAAYTFVVGDRGTRVVLNDTTARTFTIDDSIFSAGDTIFVHNINTGVLTIAAGAGVTLNGADVLTVAQYQGGTIFFTSASSAIFFPTAKTVSAGGLVFISNTAFTTASSVSLPADTFSATFNNYAVLFNLTAASTTITLTGRMRASGSDDTTANYNTNLARSTASAIGNLGNAGQTSFSLSTIDSGAGYAARLDFISPKAANKTAILANISGTEAGVSVLGLAGGLLFNTTTSFDSFSFICNTGTISGNIRVYGYADS